MTSKRLNKSTWLAIAVILAMAAVSFGWSLSGQATEVLPLEVRVADDPDCSFCKKFKAEMYGEDGELWKAGVPFTHYGLDITFFQYSVRLVPAPHIWPEWFKEAINERDVGQPKGTPTIYVWDTETNMPIIQIRGYPGKERVTISIIKAVEAYKLSQELYPSK